MKLICILNSQVSKGAHDQVCMGFKFLTAPLSKIIHTFIHFETWQFEGGFMPSET